MGNEVDAPTEQLANPSYSEKIFNMVNWSQCWVHWNKHNSLTRLLIRHLVEELQPPEVLKTLVV